MATADHCRAMADEADRLAAIVSYGRDKERLRTQAETWRAKALALETAPPPAVDAPRRAPLIRWLRRSA